MWTQSMADRGVYRWPCGVLLAAVCLATLHADEPKPSPPLTPEQQARLKEADRLGEEAQKLWQQGQRAEAVAAWEKKLAIEREVLGERSEERRVGKECRSRGAAD